MDFETFWDGAPLHYMGDDGVEYIATVKRTGDVRQTIITRADKQHIELPGVSRRASYNLPIGRSAAFMMHDEAIRHPVKGEVA